jgi:hypothetical protein
LEYTSIKGVEFSDHTPVTCTFQVTPLLECPEIDAERKNLDLQKQYFALQKHRSKKFDDNNLKSQVFMDFEQSSEGSDTPNCT